MNLFSTPVEHQRPLAARTLNCRVVCAGGLDNDLFCSVTAKLAKLCTPSPFQQTDDDTCISTLVTVHAENPSSCPFSPHIDKTFNENCCISVNSFSLLTLVTDISLHICLENSVSRKAHPSTPAMYKFRPAFGTMPKVHYHTAEEKVRKDFHQSRDLRHPVALFCALLLRLSCKMSRRPRPSWKRASAATTTNLNRTSTCRSTPTLPSTAPSSLRRSSWIQTPWVHALST